MTRTPTLEEYTQELQRKLAKKETEIVNLATYLENRECEKTNEVGSSNTAITPRYHKVDGPVDQGVPSSHESPSVGIQEPMSKSLQLGSFL